MSQKSDVVSYNNILLVTCVPFIINYNLQVPLGVLFHSEQYNDDMKEILKEVYKYIPSTTRVGDGGSGTGDSSQVSSFPTLFAGDQLTTERARTVTNVLSNSDSPSSRLEGLIPVTADWHTKMCLYKVCVISLQCLRVCVCVCVHACLLAL